MLSEKNHIFADLFYLLLQAVKLLGIKNSPSVISKPSHIILIVISFGFWLLPYIIFFTDDGGRAQIFASLFIEIFRSPHSCNIRFLTADTVFISHSPFIKRRNNAEKIKPTDRRLIYIYIFIRYPLTCSTGFEA